MSDRRAATSSDNRLLLVLASGIVGVVAGALWTLQGVRQGRPDAWTDVLEWSAAGLVIGVSISTVCLLAGLVGRPGLLAIASMVMGFILSLALVSWSLRHDTEMGDAAIARAVMGAILGLLVSLTISAVNGLRKH